jgi:hypothetical protein
MQKGSHLIEVLVEKHRLKALISVNAGGYDRPAVILRGIVHDETLEVSVILLPYRRDSVSDKTSLIPVNDDQTDLWRTRYAIGAWHQGK